MDWLCWWLVQGLGQSVHVCKTTAVAAVERVWKMPLDDISKGVLWGYGRTVQCAESQQRAESVTKQLRCRYT